DRRGAAASADALERLLVMLCAGFVVLGILVHAGDFLGGQLAHHLADADHQGIVGDDPAFRNDGARADQAIAPDHRIVQDDGLHADQRAFMDGAAVQHGLVAHRDARADRQRTAFVDVQDARFLDVAAGLDDDRRVVAADRHMRPDADPRLQGDVADDVGAVGNIHAGIDGGNELVELVNRHARSPVSIRPGPRRAFPRADAAPCAGFYRWWSWAARR